MKYRLVAACCGLLLASAAGAQTIPSRVTAGQLTAVCREDKGACLTYILGAVDGHTTTALTAKSPRALCFPAGIRNEELLTIVTRFLDISKPGANVSAASVVVTALGDRYPCPKQ